MQTPQQPEPSSSPFSRESMRNSLHWLQFIARIGSVSMEVFLRRGFGSRYLHLEALLAAMLLMAWPAFSPECDPRPMFWLFIGYLIMCAAARFEHLVAFLRGSLVDRHTRYNGAPLLCRLFPKCSEVTIKSQIEPVLIFVTGLIARSYNSSLGGYLLFASACMGLTAFFLRARDNAKLLDLRDALIEQQQLARQYRAIHPS